MPCVHYIEFLIMLTYQQYPIADTESQVAKEGHDYFTMADTFQPYDTSYVEPYLLPEQPTLMLI
jgi:hypothetical protein